MMASKSKNTPFDKMALPAVVTHTIYRGRLVQANSEIREGAAE
jgi:dihydroorotase-like cyclic amidohydrolase